MRLLKIINTVIITAFVAYGQIAMFQKQIKLGEDIQEINAYAKNIYEINGVIYIDIDLVAIKYKNTDEKVIVNSNPKLRTYIVDADTLIYANDCKGIDAAELLRRKKILLKHKSIILVGTSKNGKMVSLNFGCYG